MCGFQALLCMWHLLIILLYEQKIIWSKKAFLLFWPCSSHSLGLDNALQCQMSNFWFGYKVFTMGSFQKTYGIFHMLVDPPPPNLWKICIFYSREGDSTFTNVHSCVCLFVCKTSQQLEIIIILHSSFIILHIWLHIETGCISWVATGGLLSDIKIYQIEVLLIF